MSPRKVRLVADLIRDLDVAEAEAQLRHFPKAAALPIRKLLASAVANAEHNAKLERNNLFVRQAFVNQGPTAKRYRPRAFGRAATIRKRTSHVTIILDERVPTKSAVGHQPSVVSKETSPLPVVTERPTVPRDVHGKPIKAEETATEVVGGKRQFDIRRKGKHREEKEHELRKAHKRPGGFFKRLITRRFGEK